ncbi:hypothetical protein BaRGS_00001278 [Batillaria attramentaria]|uniref:Uncharacterized protein n=1 Tax=Batillaria attramentaria TaxID=370345 RepID=A0ABD0M780_9CAEN
MHSGAHGTVTNVRFVNWEVDAQPAHDKNLHNEIAGWGSNGHVTNWHFVNFKIGGHCITNANQADFRIDAHTTSGIDFTCGSGVVG